MRLPRLKTMDQKTTYHLRCRVAGPRHWHPLEHSEVRRMFYALLIRFTSVYRCRIVSWTILGTHYHLIIEFEPYRKLSYRELDRLAARLYRRPCDRPHTRPQYRRFNRRLFDVSELMRNLDQSLAEWYNRRFDRRGPLFMERFASTILADAQAVLDCLLYVDLNGVRAKLVERPEDWRWGSVWERTHAANSDLVPLTELLGHTDPERCLQEYRHLLYLRGAVGGEVGKGAIPEHIVQQELKRGFKGGEYLEPLRCFSKGGVLGRYRKVQTWVDSMRARGVYRQRVHPIEQLHGAFYTLRAQRRRRWDLAQAAGSDG